MSDILKIFKCKSCKRLLEVIVSEKSDGCCSISLDEPNMSCCGEKMELLIPKKDDVGNEKHIPVLSSKNGGVEVFIGSVVHPMETNHYIQFMELVTKNMEIHKKFLKPGDEPKAFFNVNMSDVLYVREYCNLHGLWIKES